jgi:hypothetical protein
MRVAAHSRLVDFGLQDGEVAQLGVCAIDQRMANVIKSFLHHIPHLMLNYARFFADQGYKTTICHTLSQATAL